MEKADKLMKQGQEFLDAGKPTKADNYFVKAWTIYNSKRAYEKVWEAIDKIVECYKQINKPELCAKYLDYKHDLKRKLKDYKGSINAYIETARIYRNHKKGKDEALQFYEYAWKENIKYAVGGEFNELIPSEARETLIEMGKPEEFADKWVSAHLK